LRSTISLRSPITDVKGIGPKKAEAFSRLDLNTLEDILRFYPREYEDLRKAKKIAELKNDEKALVEGVVMMNVMGRGYGRKRTLHLSVADKTGRMEVLFFMAGFMGRTFKVGESYRFFGKVKVENGKATMFHPVFHKADEGETGIQPVYHLSAGLTRKDMKKVARAAIDHIDEYDESLPASVLEKANICPIDYAFTNIHFPEDENAYLAARYRLVFEEFFDLKVALKLSAKRFGSGRRGHSFIEGSSDEFVSSLSYELTGAQKRVLKEIEKDMDSDIAMNRLVQGDVGSGKTVVAEAAIFKAAKAGYQAAFMAPTEILATQHYENFIKAFEPFGLNIAFLSGSNTAKERNAVLSDLKAGNIDIIVGTHAIISGPVEFKNLGLVITDEQHRFGVNQRKLLSDKGENPDVLVMTATPIPRTLAVVLYSDLDISVIDELPAGRKEIITEQFNEMNRKEAYRLLIREVRAGRQAYIVAPFIEDSESIDGRSAESLYAEFTKDHPDISAALLHGGMKQKEKDEIMQAFKEGIYSVLISTVVIEVGIDVANATVMLIENSERFGLAQLHQLRGRVGRGSEQSYCFLILGDDSEIAKERADIMCESSDGFYISEKDLEIRGPGELFGYRQHGLPQLQLADPVRHVKVLDEAARLADELLSDDPDLSKEENKKFGESLRNSFGSDMLLVL